MVRSKLQAALGIESVLRTIGAPAEDYRPLRTNVIEVMEGWITSLSAARVERRGTELSWPARATKQRCQVRMALS